MEPFRADILSVNKKGNLAFLIGVVLFAAALIVLIVIGVIPAFIEMFGILIFAYTVTRFYLQTKKQLLKKTVGELEITDESITAFNVRYFISELKAISIVFSGYRSYRKTEERSKPLSDFHTGDGNILSFVYDGKEQRFEFLLTSEQHWQSLRAHVIRWYQSNIRVIESVNGGRSYGLEILNYSQIQEFKKLISPPNSNVK